MDSLLKERMQVSGWPASDMSDASKDEYIQRVYEKENIQLNRETITSNSALKNVCKRMLNSFYGSLGIRDDYRASRFVTSAEDYVRLLTDSYKKNYRYGFSY